MQLQLLSLPRDGAPLSCPLRYTVRATEPADMQVQILDFENESHGEKKFYNTREVTVDIAPILREQSHFVPTVGATGIHDLSISRARAVRVRVEARPSADLNAASVVESFDYRTFLPCAEACSAPTLLTSMPRQRLLPQGAAEEITLYAETPQAVTVIAQRGADAEAIRYENAYGGLVAFRLNSADFPGAELLTVDAGTCGQVTYTVMPPVEGGVRLAWRSRAGSIEHYTFPIEVSRSLHTVRHTILGVNGYESRIDSETHRTLRSAFECRAVSEALADLLVSPEVWWVESSDLYTPVDVLTTQADICRHGTLSTLEIAFRPTYPESQPWFR